MLLFLGFNHQTESLPSIGSYTTFAQNVLVPDNIYDENPFQVPIQNEKKLKLVVTKTYSSPTTYSDYHTKQFEQYCVYTRIESTITVESGCRDCRLWFTNSRTGYKILVEIVIHWAWNSNQIYYCPGDQMTAQQINQEFLVGDEIFVSYANDGKPFDENVALTFIHGEQNPHFSNNHIRWANSRLRYGDVLDRRRNAIIYTINSRIFVDPGDTYVYRQYIMVGNLSSVEDEVQSFIHEAYEDLYHLGEMEDVLHDEKRNSHNIYLYIASNNTDIVFNSTNSENQEARSLKQNEISTSIEFGLTSSPNTPCARNKNIRLVCEGNSIPSVNKVPYFFITCGNKTYVGSDRYYFTPTSLTDDDFIRSYSCTGETIDVRPTWKLLGYFEEEICSEFLDVGNFTLDYDPELCNVNTVRL